MPACSVHRYGYVPCSPKVWRKLPDLLSPLSKPSPDTLWGFRSFQTHVTVSPAVTASGEGSNARPRTATWDPSGGGDPEEPAAEQAADAAARSMAGSRRRAVRATVHPARRRCDMVS